MAAQELDTLRQRVRDLQDAVDASQAREQMQDQADQATIAALTAERDRLQAIVDAGVPATVDELNEIIAGVDRVITDITTTSPSAKAKKGKKK